MSINLANCLMDRAKLASGTESDDINEAISLLDMTRSNLRDNAKAQELLAHACNSLGAAFLASRRLDRNIDAAVALEKALDAFYEAMHISEEYSDAENWGATKANIGGILAEMADNSDLKEYQAHFLRIRAISEYQAAVETFPMVAYPFQTADIHESLASVLVEHAKALNDDTLSEVYLLRAIQSYEVVGAVFTRQAHPMRWARTRERIGSIFAHHGRFPNAASPDDDLAKAAKSFEEAATLFDELGASAEAMSCRQKIAALAIRPTTRKR
jgi:tetratricopeptide (TPR) repeat protein